MCVIFFYVNSKPEKDGYKLIIASNRDEFYARKTREAGRWFHSNQIYGGIDLEAGRQGGTWLAISGQRHVIKVGALLNLTGEPKQRDAIGRGMLVTDYVSNFTDNFNINNYNSKLLENCTKYSPFNFVSIEIQSNCQASVSVCSNPPAGLMQFPERSCYGFSNSLPMVPFQKVRYGLEIFQSIVDKFVNGTHCSDDLISQLMNLLKCKKKLWPDAELQRRSPIWGEQLSAINVVMAYEGYGSRTHSVILVDSNNKMQFVEETMLTEDPFGEWSHQIIEDYFA